VGVLGVLLLCGLIALGEVACGIGLLFAVPYVSLTLAAGYCWIEGTRKPVLDPNARYPR
jgi:hypothetical protein